VIPPLTVALTLVVAVMISMAIPLGPDDRARNAVAMGLLAVVALVLTLTVLYGVPTYDPETCVDLAHLDGRWMCIPREEAG
jgi:hypothetical protein